MSKKVIFEINKELDFQNHLIGAGRVKSDDNIKISHQISEYFQRLGDADEEEKREIFEEKNSKFYSSEMIDVRNLLVRQTEEMWNLVEDKYFDKIEKIHGKNFPFKIVYGVLSTTPSVYGYNFNKEHPWFACSADSPIKAIHTAMHEIMHIYFLEYFEEECKNKYQLNDEQIYTIKESLTVILNLEFEDIRIYPDKDKLGHEIIREKIKQDWIKHKDFKKVLKETCLYIKTI